MGIQGFKTLWINQKGLCYFCFGKLSQNRRLTHIHHKNGIHSDNRFINRCLVHVSCHTTHHARLVNDRALLLC